MSGRQIAERMVCLFFVDLEGSRCVFGREVFDTANGPQLCQFGLPGSCFTLVQLAANNHRATREQLLGLALVQSQLTGEVLLHGHCIGALGYLTTEQYLEICHV